MAVTSIHPPGRFGEIEFLDDGTVIGFSEKPPTSNGRIFCGFFVLEYQFFVHLDCKSRSGIS
jgi:glucose-1-phosphate cytidylyltransferase